MTQFNPTISISKTSPSQYKNFTCSEPALDEYIKRYAMNHEKIGIGRTFVLLNANIVVGYYTLSAAQISVDDLPQEHKNLSFGLSSSDSKEFTQQILGISAEVNGQRPFARLKSARGASKLPEGEGVKPKTQVKKKMPKYPVPAPRLCRLAVDQVHQGKRIGEHLLADAIKRILQADSVMAVHSMIVDAKNQKAKSFYLKYDFLTLEGCDLNLFIPISTLRKLKKD